MLTDLDWEALGILQEECAEIVQIVNKIRRFGLESHYPGDPTTNRELLAKEIGDAIGCIIILVKAGIIDPQMIIDSAETKPARIAKWRIKS